jgi:hypothetical protein
MTLELAFKILESCTITRAPFSFVACNSKETIGSEYKNKVGKTDSRWNKLYENISNKIKGELAYTNANLKITNIRKRSNSICMELVSNPCFRSK